MYRIAVISLAMIAGCSSPFAGFRHMTQQAEALASSRAALIVEAKHGGVIRHPEAEQRMERVGARLLQHSIPSQVRYQYRLLDTDEVNAFSLPSGRVYITRGLYVQLTTDELMAAVIAHEVAHIVAKDHFKPSCRTNEEALDREIEADQLGVSYMREAKISSGAMIRLVRHIQDVQPIGWADSRIVSLQQSATSADVIERHEITCK